MCRGVWLVAWTLFFSFVFAMVCSARRHRHGHHAFVEGGTSGSSRRNNGGWSSTTTTVSSWPVKKEAVIEGDVILGGLMMIHEREDIITCGPVMPQGGVQAIEAMLYTLDQVNSPRHRLLPNVTFGAHILDDCDKDTYGLEMALDFIKGREIHRLFFNLTYS